MLRRVALVRVDVSEERSASNKNNLQTSNLSCEEFEKLIADCVENTMFHLLLWSD
jgi:hypothetical protein